MASHHFEVTIPSQPAAGQEVQERILALLGEEGFDDRSMFGMRLALEEAIVNAIKHGNKQDPAKSVTIVCTIDEEKVLVTVEDEGPGFDVGEVPDPTDESNLDKPSGRGIMLMQNFLSRVEYTGRGNRVELEKFRVEPANAS